jgi:hypothetical protein
MTLKTQYETWLLNNPDREITYEDWLENIWSNMIKSYNIKFESENFEKCWVIRSSHGAIIRIVKSDENRKDYIEKGLYIDEYKLFDK